MAVSTATFEGGHEHALATDHHLRDERTQARRLARPRRTPDPPQRLAERGSDCRLLIRVEINAVRHGMNAPHSRRCRLEAVEQPTRARWNRVLAELRKPRCELFGEEPRLRCEGGGRHARWETVGRRDEQGDLLVAALEDLDVELVGLDAQHASRALRDGRRRQRLEPVHRAGGGLAQHHAIDEGSPAPWRVWVRCSCASSWSSCDHRRSRRWCLDPWGPSELVEVGLIDLVHRLETRGHAHPVLREELAELLAADEIDRWRTVARRLGPGGW